MGDSTLIERRKELAVETNENVFGEVCDLDGKGQHSLRDRESSSGESREQMSNQQIWEEGFQRGESYGCDWRGEGPSKGQHWEVSDAKKAADEVEANLSLLPLLSPGDRLEIPGAPDVVVGMYQGGLAIKFHPPADRQLWDWAYVPLEYAMPLLEMAIRGGGRIIKGEVTA